MMLRARPMLSAGCRRMSAAAEPTVVCTEGRTARLLTLNREKALNAANLPMIRELTRHFDAYESNPRIHSIVMTGAGDKAFCAGGDIKALYDNGKNDETRSEAFAFFAEEYMLNYKLATYSTPVVSFIDGIVMGGGVGLSLPGQYRVATEATMFAMPETAIGFFPDVGGSFYLPRLNGGSGIGTWLGLTGARLRGMDVCHAGIATHFMTNPEALDCVFEELNQSVEGESEMHVFQALLDALNQTSPTWFMDNMERINKVFSGSSVEEIISNLEDQGDDEWAQQTLGKLRKMSPLSVKVTFELLQRGANLSIAEALTQEFRVAQHMMEGNDFFEGVHSVLVDRSHTPQWAHDSIEAVTSDEVESYFREPEGGGKFELQLPTERGDSVAFPPNNQPNRQDLLAAKLMFVNEYLTLGEDMAQDMEELAVIRDEHRALEEKAYRDALAKQSRLAAAAALGGDSTASNIREELLAFKQAQKAQNVQESE